jgi:parallel beta-helix repeat protein
MLDLRLLGLVRMATAVSAVLGVSALVGLAAPPSADAVACGDTLTASVVLDADLNCPVGNGLVIGADGVTVDLAGHTIAGDDAVTTFGVENAGGFDQVTVKNGAIAGFDTQIHMTGGEGHVIRSVQLRTGSHAITFEGGARFGKLLKVTAFDSDGVAIRMEGDDHQLSQIVIVNTASTAILITGSRNTVAKSTIVSPFGAGIRLSGFGENNRFTGNTISGGQSECIRVEAMGATGNVVSKNLCEANEGDGIALVGVQEGVVTGNTVIGSWENGIRVGGGSVGNLVSKNKVSGNHGTGIYVPADSTFTTILGNVAQRNRGHGIDTAGAVNTIGKNSAETNRLGGIDAPVGVVDAGGNKARNNKNFQCSPGALICK